MSKILDKRGNEIQAGDYVLTATLCTNTAHMRVAKVKEIGPKTRYGRMGTDDYVKLRTICENRLSKRVIKGWKDIILNQKVNGDYMLENIIKIEDPTQFLSEDEIQGAKKLGLL